MRLVNSPEDRGAPAPPMTEGAFRQEGPGLQAEAGAAAVMPVARKRLYRAPALEKGLAVLELLATRDGLTLTEISRILDRSISEIFRTMQVLEFRGYAACDARGGYRLTSRLFTLGLSHAPVKTQLEAALPVMRRLAAAISQSCHLVVPSGGDVIIVARVESPDYHGYSVRTGHRRPMAEATSGPVLYAFQTPNTQALWASRMFRHPDDERRPAFMAKARAVREQRLLSQPCDLVEGVTDLCAPILTRRIATAALTVPYLQRSGGLSLEEASLSLTAAAAAISDTLDLSDDI